MDPIKPISAIYFEGEKAKYYIKRFVIDAPEKEERFISEHPKSQLQIVVSDYRPNVEVVFSKRSLENKVLDLEEFIAVKGIKAIGNQFTEEKIKQVNLLEPHPYTPPVLEAIEVEEENFLDKEDPQTALF